MKKHAVTIINIVLVLAIISGIALVIFNAPKREKQPETATPDEVVVASANDAQKPFNIAIIQHTDNEECNACYKGFVHELTQLGYINSGKISIDYILEQDEEKCSKAIDEKLSHSKYDLIYAIGPFCAKKAAEKTTDIPIVFGAVSEPEKEGLVESNEVPGKNITGVSSYTPCFEQIDSIMLLFPKTKKIGAIFCGTNEASVTQALVAQGEAESDEIGYTYNTYPVVSSDEISEKLEEMKEDGIEVIYAPIDSMIYENMNEVVSFSEDNKIPIICGNEEMLKKGCFSTCNINYVSIGTKAADMTLDILVHNAKPANTPVIYKYDCDLLVNKKSCENLGITLSDSVKSDVIMKSYE